MSLSLIDWIIIAAYLIFLLIVTVKVSRGGSSDVEDYIVGSRRLTLPAFVATTVSTWYGGILGVGEYSFKYGLSNWLVFGIPYYIAALLFALLLAERARKSRLLSIPDQLRGAYGDGVAVGGAIYVFVMTVPAVYVLMLGVLLKLLFGWQLWFGVTVAAVFSSSYVLIGGFRAVVKTDWVQFALMYLSFAIMVVILITDYGGIAFLKERIPAGHFQWHGGNTAGYIFSWYFIALAALVEPAFYQRAYAARTPKIAKRGFLISIIFWFAFDAMTTTVGLYSRALLDGNINALEAFPRLADQILPPGLKGIFLVGLATTIQSTIDSYSFLAASTLGRDVLWRLRSVRSRFTEVSISKWGLVISGLLAIGIALYSESVVEIWHKLGSLGTPGLLLPLALSYNAKLKFRPKWAYLNLIIVPLVVGTLFILQASIENLTFPLNIQPIFWGFTISLSLLVLDHLRR
jgi:SSS family solute:Na+ symporter